MNQQPAIGPARAASMALISAIILPVGLALFIPWFGQSVEFKFLAATHLLALALVTLCLAMLLRVMATVGHQKPFGSRVTIGLCGAGIVCGASVRWLTGFEGNSGHPVLVLSLALTLGTMLLVVGYLFEFIRAFLERMKPTDEDEKQTEVAS